MNSCSECEVGYSFKFDPNTQTIDHSECVANLQSGSLCLAFDPTDKLCKACRRGFYLNKDSFCSKLSTQYCKAGFLDYKYGGSYLKNSPSFYTYIFHQGYGCTYCEGDTSSNQYDFIGIENDTSLFGLQSNTCVVTDFLNFTSRNFR